MMVPGERMSAEFYVLLINSLKSFYSLFMINWHTQETTKLADEDFIKLITDVRA